MGFYVVEPADENGGDENRETKKHKYRIGLGEGGRVDQIELDSKYCHHEKCDKRESGSESRNSVRPVDGIEYYHIPNNREDKGNEINLERSENDIVLIQIEYSAKYIGNVSNLDARDSDNRPHTDLHYEPDFGWYEEWSRTSHLSELLGGFLHVALAGTIKFINRVEIVHETYERDNPPEYEDDKKSLLIYITEKWMKENREEEKIEIEYTPDTERYRFSFVSVRSRIIEESETRKKIFPDMENKE